MMLTEKTFGEIAVHLAANGYEPVPIIRGEKRPAVDKWQQGGWEKQTANFMSSFTGLLTRNNPAVDIDVSDPALVQQIRCRLFIGTSHTTRLDPNPKREPDRKGLDQVARGMRNTLFFALRYRNQNS